MYCYVEEGVVVEGPMKLPTNWRNISNLSSLADAELEPIGWLPYVVTKDAKPNEYYTLSDGGMVVGASSVTRHYTAVQMDIDTIKEAKLNRLTSAPFSQDSYAEDFEGRKIDAGEWAERQRISLDAMTERAPIEAFDAVTVSAIPSRRVAEVMLKQAEEYLTEEDFRDEVGASLRVSLAVRTVINTWMKGNYDAIDNGTVAVTPPEEIRQKVRVPGESRGRFLLRRQEWTGQHGFKAWVEAESVAGLTLKAYNASDVELFELEFVQDIPGRWVTGTAAGQRSGSEIPFKFRLVWGSSNNLMPLVPMAVGTNQHSIRAMRWGGV